MGTHSTFWAYERALAWLAEADKTWANQPDAAFGSWVAVMTAQLFDAPVKGSRLTSPPVRSRATGRAWRDRLEDLGETPWRTAWLDAAGLLCTPEMGMTSFAAVQALLPSGCYHPDRPSASSPCGAQRAKNLPSSLRSLAQPLAEQLAESTATTDPSPSRPEARPQHPGPG